MGKEVEVRGERGGAGDDGQFKAIAAICPHAGGELASGSVRTMGEGGRSCLLPGAFLHARHGERRASVTAKSCSCAAVYETRVALGRIYVRV